MVSNELTGALHSQFWHFSLSPLASGGWVHPLVCPQLCVLENWSSPSQLQKTEFQVTSRRQNSSHAPQASLNGACALSCAPCLSTASYHPTPGFVLQGQWLSPPHSHPTHIHQEEAEAEELGFAWAAPATRYWAPRQTLGTPCHTQQCASSSCCAWHLLQINWVGLNRWAELCSWKGVPLLPWDPARHCCAWEPIQSTPDNNCRSVLTGATGPGSLHSKDALNTLMASAKTMAQPGFCEQHRHADGWLHMLPFKDIKILIWDKKSYVVPSKSQ